MADAEEGLTVAKYPHTVTSAYNLDRKIDDHNFITSDSLSVFFFLLIQSKNQVIFFLDDYNKIYSN